MLGRRGRPQPDLRQSAERHSRVNQKIVVLDLHGPGPDRPLRWSAEDGARGHVELATVAGGGHDSPGQTSIGERTTHMGAGVVERVEMTLRIGKAYVRSGDIETSIWPSLMSFGLPTRTDTFVTSSSAQTLNADGRIAPCFRSDSQGSVNATHATARSEALLPNVLGRSFMRGTPPDG
jgi:hypothetical protein